MKVSAPARRLVIMVKDPVMGRVKTRLAREIGPVEATRFYRTASRAVVARLAADRRWHTVLAVAPDRAVRTPCWPAAIERHGQGEGDLGRRMQAIMEWEGAGPIVIVGTDIPAIRPDYIAAAFRALGANDAVLGPADDGGYWLVGLARVPRIIAPFEDVRWSSPETLADTVANLRDRSIARVATLSDVDNAADFIAVASWSGRRILPLST